MSSWFPRLNYDGTLVESEGPNKWQAQFMGERRIWQNGDNLVIDGVPRTSIPGPNKLAAGAGDKWAGWRTDPIRIYSSFRNTLPGAGSPAISPNGFYFAYADNDQAAIKNLILEWEIGGTRYQAILATGGIADVRLSDSACCWTNNGALYCHWFGVREGPTQVLSREFGPVPVNTPSGVWVGSYTDTGIIVRPAFETRGYRFDNGGNTYNPDFMWHVPSNRIRAVFTDRFGNFGEQYFDLSLPRQDLTKPPIVIEPEPPTKPPKFTVHAFVDGNRIFFPYDVTAPTQIELRYIDEGGGEPDRIEWMASRVGPNGPWDVLSVSVGPVPAKKFKLSLSTEDNGTGWLKVQARNNAGSHQTLAPRQLNIAIPTQPEPPDPEPQPEPEPEPTRGKLYIKTTHDTYLSLDAHGYLNHTSQKTSFELVEQSNLTGGRVVGIRGPNGKFGGTENDGRILFSRDEVGSEWEEFLQNDLGHGVLALRSMRVGSIVGGPPFGWVSAYNDNTVRADTPSILSQETFRTEPVPDVLPGFMGKITIDGEFFRNNGERVTIVECSDFSLFRRFLDNDQLLIPVLNQRLMTGFNCLRVWLLNESVVAHRNPPVVDIGITPKAFPDFYTQLKKFAHWMKEHGLLVEFTVFTQTPKLMPSQSEQQDHLNRTVDAIAADGHLLELVNEDDHGGGTTNKVSNNLTRPGYGLCSNGSMTADTWPRTPVWNYQQYHSNDLSEWQRKVGHNAMEIAHEYKIPVISNENTRSPDRDPNLLHHYDAAAGAALLCAGSCFHSVNGKMSNLWQGIELECAREWVRGAMSVPVEFQAGVYARHDERNSATVIRSYSRTLGDGRRHYVDIHK